MKKYLLGIILSFLLYTNSVFALEIDVKSENLLLYNLKENKIIYEQNSEKNTKIASLTKIVTVLVALENINDLNEKLILNEDVFVGLVEADASVAGFEVGETVTYKDLLYGALLPSGADATRALAINLFGSEKEFVNKMNDLMIKLKITDTYFTNTSGLDETGQKATLKDLLNIMLYAFKNNQFIEIFNSSNYITYSGRLNLKSTLSNYEKTHSLNTSIIKGSKTGYTDLAGLCLISYAKKDEMELLLISTNAPVDDNRYPYNVTDALNIYNYYFDNYGYHTLLNKNQIITNTKIKYSDKNVDLVYKEKELKYFLPNNYKENIKFDIITTDSISFKTNVNKPVGTFIISYQNKQIYEGNLYLSEKISFSILDFIKYNKYYIAIFTTIIFFIIYNKSRKKVKHGF